MDGEIEPPAFSLEVNKESNQRDLLFALSQCREDKKALPSRATANTVQSNGHGIEVVIGNTSSPHNAQCPDPRVDGQRPRQTNAPDKYPLCSLNWDGGLEVIRPRVSQSDQSVRCEGVGAVDRDGDEDEDP
jgi:hypothetical protein